MGQLAGPPKPHQQATAEIRQPDCAAIIVVRGRGNGLLGDRDRLLEISQVPSPSESGLQADAKVGQVHRPVRMILWDHLDRLAQEIDGLVETCGSIGSQCLLQSYCRPLCCLMGIVSHSGL